MENLFANNFARGSANVVLLFCDDATAVMLHPMTDSVAVKSCAILPTWFCA